MSSLVRAARWLLAGSRAWVGLAVVVLVGSWGSVAPLHSQSATADTIAYTVVLDVSGSMSWDFNGLGTWLYGSGANGNDYQCETFNPDINLPYAQDVGLNCAGGPTAPWRIVEERRIYAARMALLDLVSLLRPDDRIRLITFSSDIEASSAQWYSKTIRRLPMRY
ncbi:MAG: hypothetical protein HC914_16930 [Chloroflexaceae bacterium]|nr:hypothetical protein [Chloroflexaceae bacterium]